MSLISTRPICFDDFKNLNTNKKTDPEISKITKRIGRWLFSYNKMAVSRNLPMQESIYSIWKRIMQISPEIIPHWVDRIGSHTRMIIEYNMNSHCLIGRIKPPWLTTSNRNLFWLRSIIKQYLEQYTILRCFYNLDTYFIKNMIKGIISEHFGNNQVYENTSVNFADLLDNLSSRILNEMDTFLDTRFIRFKKFEGILNTYQRLGCKIEIIDVEVSIWQYIINAFDIEELEKYGYASRLTWLPLSFDAIKNDIIDLRKFRRQFLEYSNRENINYSLYHSNINGRFSLIAENRNKNFTCHNEIFEDYLKIPLEEEVDAIGFMQITKDLINQLEIPPEKKCLLEAWEGYSVINALEQHSQSRKYKVPILPLFVTYLPFNQAEMLYNQDLEISDEFQSSDYYTIFHRAVMYIRRGGKSEEDESYSLSLELTEQKIFDFLQGIDSLESIGITEHNALSVLRITKIIDIANRKNLGSNLSSYPIRKKILQISSSEVSTCEVYTNSFKPEKYTSFDYLIKTNSWVDERVAEQAKLTINYTLLSKSLSQRIKGTVIATRGNTGVGKSFWVKHFVKKYLEENKNILQGVLNPDCIKAVLKNNTNKRLLNNQVYAEGRVIFERYFDVLTKQKVGTMGAVIDTRLLSIEEFNQVLAFSQLRGAILEIIDVDAPIWNSIISVFSRKPYGKDPCVCFEIIKDGFIKARQNRREFIEASKRENVNYSLYYLDPNGEFLLVAQNRNNYFIHTDETFEESLKIPSEEEIDEIGHTEITEELISSLVFPFKNKQVLEKWKGYSIEKALQLHSRAKF